MNPLKLLLYSTYVPFSLMSKQHAGVLKYIMRYFGIDQSITYNWLTWLSESQTGYTTIVFRLQIIQKRSFKLNTCFISIKKTYMM